MTEELDGEEISTPKVKEIRGMSQNQNQNIIITQSGLALVKSIFRYIELLNILNKYSFEIVVSLFKIFEFYIFTVFFTFANVEKQRGLFDDATIA